MFGRQRDEPSVPAVVEERAERLTTVSRRDVRGETAPLTDRVTVERWLGELRPADDVQVFIHRSWGVVVASIEKDARASLLWGDGDHADGATCDSLQMTRVMLDALTSAARPDSVVWESII